MMGPFVKKKYLIAVSWIILVIWMLLIFFMSSQPAVQSNGMSTSLTRAIIDTISQWFSLRPEPAALSGLVDMVNFIIRKLAHGTSYFILGMLAVNAYARSLHSVKKAYWVSALFCILYAISDEIHQLFVPGRSGEIRDVLIDSTGALLAILLFWGIRKIKQRTAGDKRIH